MWESWWKSIHVFNDALCDHLSWKMATREYREARLAEHLQWLYRIIYYEVCDVKVNQL